MLRTQRLRRDIGNGGDGTCEISYMQGRKFPNAGETVEPVQGVSNKNLLKNPYNTLNEPIAVSGKRPLRITTDNRGNVFARSETELVANVTNDNLLKNPNNIKSVPVGEKRTLSLQRIKDINNKMLPSYITENKGINEVMLQILTMIENKQVKLITIQLLKMLVTKNVPINSAHSEQKVLQALNYFDIVLTYGRRIFKENTLSPTKIPDGLRPAINTYVDNIVKLYGINVNASPPNIDIDIQTGLAELGLLSNALTRMFEFNNSVDPSNTLTRDQINAAAYSGFGQPPQPEQRQQAQLPPQPEEETGKPPQPEEEKSPLNPDRIMKFLEDTEQLYKFIGKNAEQYDLQALVFFHGLIVNYYYAIIRGPSGKPDYETDMKYQEEIIGKLLSMNSDNTIRILQDVETLKNIQPDIINEAIGVRYRKPELDGMINKLETYIKEMIFFFNNRAPSEVAKEPIVGEGRMHRRPTNKKVVFQTGKKAAYHKY